MNITEQFQHDNKFTYDDALIGPQVVYTVYC